MDTQNLAKPSQLCCLTQLAPAKLLSNPWLHKHSTLHVCAGFCVYLAAL